MLALALGCPTEPIPPPSEASTSPPTTELRTRAHADAYARLLPLAVAAFELADPIAAAQLGRGAPRVRPLGTGERARLRDAIAVAWTEAAQIDASVLDVEQGAVLRVVRFGLLRWRDDLDRNPLTRTDPTVAIAAVADLVDALEEPSAAALAPADVASALEHAAAMLREGIADLAATSPESLASARTDVDALSRRVAPWTEASRPIEIAAAARTLAAEITATRERLAEIAAALPKAEPATHDDRLARAAEPALVRRLPARLGAAALRRRLEVEESESRPAGALFDAVLDTTRKLAAMRATKPAPHGAARRVDAERCTTAWATIERYAATQPALKGVGLACTAFVATLADRELDDAALTVALVHAGIVLPSRSARRRDVLPALALVGGRIAPASHVHAQTLAVVAGLDDPGARALALGDAGDALCRAATGLWVHGNLGDDATLATRLGDACEHRSVDAWIAEALARPRASLDGLGLELLGLGPADVVALERYWWLPIGLVVPTARPAPPAEPTPAADVKIEPLLPAGATTP